MFTFVILDDVAMTEAFEDGEFCLELLSLLRLHAPVGDLFPT